MPTLTPQELMEIKFQFIRLKYHKERLENSPHLVPGWDLTHTLRIWCEMREKVDLLGVKNFTNPVRKKLDKEIRRVGSSSYVFHIDPKVSVGETTITGVRVIQDPSGDPSQLAKTLYEQVPPQFSEEKYSYSEWLGTTVADYIENGLPTFQLNRSFLIKRYANIFGASHPFLTYTEENAPAEAKNDIHLFNFEKMNIGDLPVVLLYMQNFASEIIRSFEEHLKV